MPDPLTYRQTALFQLIQSLDDGQTHKLTIVCRGNDPWNVGVSLDSPESKLQLSPDVELSREERWKAELHPLDVWDRIVSYASDETAPDTADSYRLKYHGLFSKGGNLSTYMLRVKVPANQLTSSQLRGLAAIAQDMGGGYADITSRGNLQIRDIQARCLVNLLNNLNDLGLTSKGTGADNIRNITVSPISGLDPDEYIDVRAYARELHHYILNHRDMFGLPRKFNIAFDNGGRISVAAHTNDIGVVPVRLKDSSTLPAGICFRIMLAGVPGHGALARDAGIIVRPENIVPVLVSIIRTYDTHGNRSDRRHARLKYLLEEWGLERFVSEAEILYGKPFTRLAAPVCDFPASSHSTAHIGVHRQKQPGRYYVGIAVPAGRLSTEHMGQLANLADLHGDGRLLLTVRQNLILPNVPESELTETLNLIESTGLHYRSGAISSGLLACTGAPGCNVGLTNTKTHSLRWAELVEKKIKLDVPITIHVAGCRNSCTKPKCADIGLLGGKASLGGASIETYHVFLGGGVDEQAGLGEEVWRFVPHHQIAGLIERILTCYQNERESGESFNAFCRRAGTEAIRQAIGPVIEIPLEEV